MDILIAEDDVVSRKFLQKMLEEFGHTVIAAEDGRKAWQLFKENKVKIVITDWMMPEMDGIALCEKIRHEEQSDYVYVIILTARDGSSDTVKGLDAGADDFITKPIDPEELKARIRVGQRIFQLEDAHKKASSQLLQSEKMASVGQLAAGIAHEINNPIGFVGSNLKSLSDYQGDINRLIEQYRKLVRDLKENEKYPSSVSEQVRTIASLEAEMDVDFIIGDVPDLIEESREGIERIKKIVIDLKDFAHPGEDKLEALDINQGIESTLNVVRNELKYKATVEKQYGEIPLVQGYPQQLNQVFMNIFVNAAQAMENMGVIKIETKSTDGFAEILISDTGSGISKESIPKLFDPFFTTKEVGKGTGLGLHVAYDIIQKHNGSIDVHSEVGKGTTFRIRIPAAMDYDNSQLSKGIVDGQAI